MFLLGTFCAYNAHRVRKVQILLMVSNIYQYLMVNAMLLFLPLKLAAA